MRSMGARALSHSSSPCLDIWEHSNCSQSFAKALQGLASFSSLFDSRAAIIIAPPTLRYMEISGASRLGFLPWLKSCTHTDHFNRVVHIFSETACSSTRTLDAVDCRALLHVRFISGKAQVWTSPLGSNVHRALIKFWFLFFLWQQVRPFRIYGNLTILSIFIESVGGTVTFQVS